MKNYSVTNIKVIRALTGLNIQDFAKKIQVSKSYQARIEKNERRITPAYLDRICKFVFRPEFANYSLIHISESVEIMKNYINKEDGL